MADSFTPNLNLTKPEIGGSHNTWGQKYHEALDLLDGLFGAPGGHGHAGAGQGPQIGPLALNPLVAGNAGMLAVINNGEFKTVLMGAGVTLDAPTTAPSLRLRADTLGVSTLMGDGDFFVAQVGADSRRITRTNALKNAVGSGRTAYRNNGSVSGPTPTLDLNLGLFHSLELVAFNQALVFANPPADAVRLILELVFLGGPPVWPGSVLWDGGSAPTLEASKTYLFEFWTRDSGAVWRGRRIWSPA